VKITAEGREELETIKERGGDDVSILYDLCDGPGTAGIIGNSDIRIFNAGDLGHLSEAPLIAEQVNYDQDAPAPAPAAGSRQWYFEPYQIRSVADDLLEHGEAIFTELK
jgi:hypothetical protein